MAVRHSTHPPSLDACSQVLGEITGRTTVPRVFVGGVSVGGCDDTVAANKSGKLKQLLQQAGAL